MKYIKSYNESIRHLLKPKSEDEIKKSIEKLNTLTPTEILFKGAEFGFLDVVKDAFKQGANLHIDRDAVLMVACSNGHADIVRFLIDAGCNLKERNGAFLRVACMNGHIDVVKVLLEKGILYDASTLEFSRATEACIDNGYIDIYNLIMKYPL